MSMFCSVKEMYLMLQVAKAEDLIRESVKRLNEAIYMLEVNPHKELAPNVTLMTIRRQISCCRWDVCQHRHV